MGLGVAGWVNGSVGLLAGVILTFAIVVSAAACVITQTLVLVRQRDRPGR